MANKADIRFIGAAFTWPWMFVIRDKELSISKIVQKRRAVVKNLPHSSFD
jgi:hypothetical protein